MLLLLLVRPAAFRKRFRRVALPGDATSAATEGRCDDDADNGVGVDDEGLDVRRGVERFSLLNGLLDFFWGGDSVNVNTHSYIHTYTHTHSHTHMHTCMQTYQAWLSFGGHSLGHFSDLGSPLLGFVGDRK